MATLSKAEKATIIILLIMLYSTACFTISKKLDFDTTNTILLFLSGGSFLVAINPLLKIIGRYRHKKTEAKQTIVNRHMAIAEKANLKPFSLGNKKQHVVWAKNNMEATLFYQKHIKPLTTLNPYKEYYYISKACNNLNLYKHGK